MTKGQLYIERWMGNVSQTKANLDIIRIIEIRDKGTEIYRYYSIARDRRQIRIKARTIFENRYVKYNGSP